MKKFSLLLAALCAGMLFGAELPDFSKAETWLKASWSKSTYAAADGVMSIERVADQGNGSGAWRSVWFAVKPGETFAGSVDFHFITKGDNRAHGRVGIDFYGANDKRVQFCDGASFYQTNDGFDTKTFNFKAAPEGAVKACIFLCFDGLGKVEFKNVKIEQK